MRQLLLTPRWLVRLAVAVLLIAAFLALGWWQWARARSGNTLSWAYTFEWPLFAGFVVFFCWRMLQLELDPPEQPERQLVEPPPPPPVVEDRDDPELAAYNRYLAALHEQDRRQAR